MGRYIALVASLLVTGCKSSCQSDTDCRHTKTTIGASQLEQPKNPTLACVPPGKCTDPAPDGIMESILDQWCTDYGSAPASAYCAGKICDTTPPSHCLPEFSEGYGHQQGIKLLHCKPVQGECRVPLWVMCSCDVTVPKDTTGSLTCGCNCK